MESSSRIEDGGMKRVVAKMLQTSRVYGQRKVRLAVSMVCVIVLGGQRRGVEGYVRGGRVVFVGKYPGGSAS